MDISLGYIGRFSMDLVLLIQRDCWILTFTLHKMQFYVLLKPLRLFLILKITSFFGWKTYLCPLPNTEPELHSLLRSQPLCMKGKRMFLWWYFYFFTLWASDRPVMMRMCDVLFAELSEPSLQSLVASLSLWNSRPVKRNLSPVCKQPGQLPSPTSQLGPLQFLFCWFCKHQI